jgi:outer membrane protein assembly factor BamD (BamD/ComL family)
LLPLGGCVGSSWNPFRRPDDPPPPAGEGLVLREGKLEKDVSPAAGTAAAELEAAKELYQKGDYAKAEGLFHKVANNTKNPPLIAEEACFYEADCYRLQTRYPAAVDTYKKQLKDFPAGAFKQKALKQMFDIANYWLDETREVMKAQAEKQDGKRSFVMPVSFVHFDKTKPLLDLEGTAVLTMEQVYLNDPTGPLGERALWYVGNVRLYHEDYHDADFYFSQIVKNYQNGEFAPKALELSILCKQMCPGGPEYDCRKVAEARQLVDVAMKAYPELREQKSEFLHRQLYTINLQQAAKDYSIAQFYERTRHPGSAYFCYEIVRRRYPGTKYAEDAAKRMEALRERAQKDLEKNAAKAEAATPDLVPVPAGPAPAATLAAPVPGTALTAPEELPRPAPLPGLGGGPPGRP